MGFCRRCGEIVPAHTTRCKCGGFPVAPTVQWNRREEEGRDSPDRWAETYVLNDMEQEHNRPVTPITTMEQASSPPKSLRGQTTDIYTDHSPTRPTRRFPRPLSANASFGGDKSAPGMASSTVDPPITPMQHRIALTSGGSTLPDVITSPDNVTLAKVYGSVLQRPETLPIHICASCSAIFPPDATIYPDPQTPPGDVPRFFCRPCFAVHGGSKGDCAVCGREVLTATREGGFVEKADKVWHKRCFRCEGCYKEIGDAPMVDIFGLPSCAECFDTCLDRKGNPKTKKQPGSSKTLAKLRRSRESSPVLEELSERLGIIRSPTSQATRNITRHSNDSPTCEGELDSNRDSPHRPNSSYLRSQNTPTTQASFRKSPAFVDSTRSSAETEMEPTTPDLSSGSSVSTSSYNSTPSPQPPLAPISRETMTPKVKCPPMQINIVTTTKSRCGKCLRSLFDIDGSGRIVTVPSESSIGEPVLYHASCFRCVACGDTFDSERKGRAIFVKSSNGICHPECASTGTISTDGQNCQDIPVTKLKYNSSGQPPASAPPLTRSFPRFGGSGACPGCCKAVSLMECGVVPGPQNTRWHVNCLTCGGKGAKPPRPGCGKKLDSAAKTDREGRVWCRECLLLLPAEAYSSPQGSPTRGGLVPSYTGTIIDRFPNPPETGRLFGQVTGNAFVKSDALMAQLTGGLIRRGSVSPTRQSIRSVSPTKGLMPVTRHPRPMGMWKHRRVEEGRGMFLVKQMTGNGL